MARGGRKLNPEKEFKDFIYSMEEFLHRGQYPSLTILMEGILNYLMQKEREFYLQRNPEVYANGTYKRTLTAHFGQLHLRIPRVRISNTFRPALLPQRWKRFNKDYEEFLLACLVNGYSKAKIEKLCQNLGISYSEDALQILEEFIEEKLDYFKMRPLPEEMFAVFIDAYHSQLKDEGKMNAISIFVGTGIDLEGYKHILGYWVMKGKENIGFWTEVLQDLISRGLSKVAIFVTDHFNGLEKLIPKLFPLSDHQFCFVHFYRNLKNQLLLKSMKEVYQLWKAVRQATDIEEGQKYFGKLLELVKKINPKYVSYLERYSKNYLAFLNYPEEIRKHIYTTNVIESINAGLEYMRMEHGGYFGSWRVLELNLFVQFANLHDRWLDKPIPNLAGLSYRLKQIFALKFGEAGKVIDLEVIGAVENV